MSNTEEIDIIINRFMVPLTGTILLPLQEIDIARIFDCCWFFQAHTLKTGF